MEVKAIGSATRHRAVSGQHSASIEAPAIVRLGAAEMEGL